jgi:hypothetical protein
MVVNYWDDGVKEEYAIHIGDEKFIQICFRKPEGSLWRHRCRWEDNTNMNLREIL